MTRVVLLFAFAVACSSAKPPASPPAARPAPAAWVPAKVPDHSSRCVSVASCMDDAERALPLACARLGDLVDNGALVTVSDVAALGTRLEARCRAGDIQCCSETAKLECDPPGPGSWESCRPAARGLFELGCTKGDVYACMGLHIVLRKGLGVPADEGEAGRVLERATAVARSECDRGDAESCALAGQLFHVTHDDAAEAEASRRFHVATEERCGAGDGLACFTLARVYASQTPPDEERMKQSVERACKLGVVLNGCP